VHWMHVAQYRDWRWGLVDKPICLPLPLAICTKLRKNFTLLQQESHLGSQFFEECRLL
jgi:hypothetical protein